MEITTSAKHRFNRKVQIAGVEIVFDTRGQATITEHQWSLVKKDKTLSVVGEKQLLNTKTEPKENPEVDAVDEDDDEEEVAPFDIAAYTQQLNQMTLAALKKEATDLGYEPKLWTSLNKGELLEFLIAKAKEEEVAK